MSLSEDSDDYYSERRLQFERLKQDTHIGIFGSFYKGRKADLLALKDYLCKNGYDARIAEELDTRPEKDRKKRDPEYDRKFSEQLLRESDIHIFVLPREHDDEPPNLSQSVSMEIERLHTMSECGYKSEKYVAVYAENGLMGTMGGVCEGLIASKEHDWNVEEFKTIGEIFKPARQFCLNCILDLYYSQ